jgi:hypothetical protein
MDLQLRTSATIINIASQETIFLGPAGMAGPLLNIPVHLY